MRTILFSGGLDSLLLARRYPDATLVHIDYGQSYRAEEHEAAYRIADDFQRPVVELTTAPLTAAAADGHIPHRNLYLAVCAVALLPETTDVLLGGVRGETSPDKSARFLRAASRALSRSESRRVRMIAPLRHATKAKHLRRLVAEVGKPEAQRLLNLTVSCYAPPGPVPQIGCGRCLACLRRWVAVESAGLAGTWAYPPWQQLRETQARDLLPYLRRTPISELPGVLVNQWEALRVLRR